MSTSLERRKSPRDYSHLEIPDIDKDPEITRSTFYKILRYFRDRLNWHTQVAYVSLNLFIKTEMQNHAAAVAFYFLLSIAPLMLLIVYIVNTFFPNNPEFMEAFSMILSGMHMNFDASFSQNIKDFSGAAKLSGGVSILILLWSSKGLMRSIHSSFGLIFADSKKRDFISATIISFLLLPFSFLLVGMTVVNDYLINHFNYASLGMPVVADFLQFFFSFLSFLSPGLVTWGIIFFFYYKIPPKKPPFFSAFICSLLCTLSVAALEIVSNHIVKIEQYIDIYGSLGAIIFALIWVYFSCMLFFLWAEILYVVGKIDVIALEKIFIDRADRGKFSKKIERFLFNRSGRVFAKYGRNFRKGERIVRQDDDTAEIYFLYSGQVGLYRSVGAKESRLGWLNAGEVFGEMAYLLDERRTATVVAETDCFIFTLTPETLEALLGYSTKLSRRVIESLCQRIAKTNQGILSSGFASATHRHPVFNPDAGTV